MKEWAIGRHLRMIRENRGLTLKAVEDQSRRIAKSQQNMEYLISTGRLSQIENSDSSPSIYKFASLSEIYQVSYMDLLRFYGVQGAEKVLPQPNKTPLNGEGRGQKGDNIKRSHPSRAA